MAIPLPWIDGAAPAPTGMLSRPLTPIMPLTPLMPLMPLQPLRLLTPVGGWSNLTWNNYVAQ